MALLIVTGVPGTGKTLYAIQKYIIPALRKNKHVYTNIDGIAPKRICQFFHMDILDVEDHFHVLTDPAFFWKETKKESLIVLDESQNIYSNRNWQAKQNQEVSNYLMEHRHYGHHVIFITPHIDSLDANIRRVAEFTYKHKSFSALGSAKTVICGVFDQCNVTSQPIQKFQWKHDTRIYNIYNSYFEENIKEEKPRVHPLKNKKLIMLVIFSVSMLIYGARNLTRLHNNMYEDNEYAVEEMSLIEETKNKTRKINSNNSVIKINSEIITGQQEYKRGIR